MLQLNTIALNGSQALRKEGLDVVAPRRARPSSFSHEVGGLLSVEAPVDKAILDEISALDMSSAKILCGSEPVAFGPRNGAR